MASKKQEGAYVALLRGINVGGKNKIPMPDLAAIFTETGCAGVRTYIQSGNVIFGASAKLAAALPAAIADRIEARFGARVPVVLRSAAELAAALEDNPFLAEGADPEALHLMFLAGEPAAAAVARLDAQRSPGDRFAVRGREIYLFCPNGLARTRLTNDYFDRALATVSTVRNLRTASKLAELARGAP